MSQEIIVVCPECGFSAVQKQYFKCKGKCPMCKLDFNADADLKRMLYK